MPWPFPSTPTPAKPLHHLNARHWRWAFSALAFPQPLRGSPSGKVILLALETHSFCCGNPINMTQTWSIFQLLVLTKRVLPSVTLIYSKSWKKKGSQWSVGLLDTSRFKYEPSCDWYSKKNLKFHWFSTEIHHLDMFIGFFMVLNFENEPILGLHPQQCRGWKWNLTTWWTLHHPINHVVGWWKRHWWRLDGRFVWG